MLFAFVLVFSLSFLTAAYAETDGTDTSDNTATTLAADDAEYTLTYNYRNNQNQTSSRVASLTVIIVDENGNAISKGQVDTSFSGSSLSYTQTGTNNNSSNSYYSLSSLASNFTVTDSEGSTLTFIGAKVGYSNSGFSRATDADYIRYNGSSMQYRTESSQGGGNQSWSSFGNSWDTIYLQYGDQSSIVSGMSFGHIDVKTDAAYTGDETSLTVTNITLVQYTRATDGQLVTVRGSFQTNEWRGNDQNLQGLTGASTVTITFTLSDGTTSTTYTSTITASTTYPEDTYYPADGDCAYKLYNYINGTNISERDWNATYGDIDISGMRVFLVSAIVCNGSTVSGGSVSGNYGLDLVLNVATLLGSAPNFDFVVEKTLNGSTSLTDAQFSFTFQKASVDENDTWTLDSTATGDNKQELKTEEETATEEGATSITQTIAGDQVTYSTSSTEESTTYYYILQENQGTADDGVTYDDTVYGIAVVVETTRTSGSSSGGTSSAYNSFETKVDSVTVYELTLSDNGTYTQDKEVTISQNSSDEYVFPFTNSITKSVTIGGDGDEYSIDVAKVLSGRGWQEGDSFEFTLSAEEGTPMPDETTLTISYGDVDEDGDYTASFGEITYKKAGTYTYTITEAVPDGATDNGDGTHTLDGVTYDNATYTVTVVVESDGKGNLSVESVTYEVDDETKDSATFTNAYADGTVTIGGDGDEYSIDVAKVLSGRGWQEGDSFEFTLSAEEGTPMPDETTLTISYGDVDEDGDYTASFGEITYKKAGTYTYTITEAVPDGATDNGDGTHTLDGVTYDNATYTVTVVVESDGKGNLSVESVTYEVDDETKDSATFTNVYTASDEETPADDPTDDSTDGDSTDDTTETSSKLPSTGDTTVMSVAIAGLVGVAAVAAGVILRKRRA